MREVPIKLGPIALLLTIISICLTTLGILTMTTAQADLRLSNRFAETVRTRYNLEQAGQELMKALQDALEEGVDPMAAEKPEGSAVVERFEKQDDEYICVLSEDETTLTIRFTVEGEGLQISCCEIVRNWEEEGSMNLWDGSR